MIMKKILTLCLGAVICLGIALYGLQPTTARADNKVEAPPAPKASGQNNNKILIVYFSLPESTDAKNMTNEGNNSAVVINDKVVGNTEYVAQLIQSKVGGDLFRIEPQKPYDISDHGALTSFARNEKNSNARPAIAKSVANMANYDVVFVGYPNWWGDMPMIMYSFLEQYNLAGKKIIPFNTHGGSGLSDTVATIASLQPKATVEKNAFTIYRREMSKAANEVDNWLKKIAY